MGALLGALTFVVAIIAIQRSALIYGTGRETHSHRRRAFGIERVCLSQLRAKNKSANPAALAFFGGTAHLHDNLQFHVDILHVVKDRRDAQIAQFLGVVLQRFQLINAKLFGRLGHTAAYIGYHVGQSCSEYLVQIIVGQSDLPS